MAYHLGFSRTPKKAVMLTFDDGYENVFTDVLPVLADLDAVATSFVTTSFVGGTSEWDTTDLDPIIRHLSWEQIKTAYKTGLVDFQSHTDTHPYMPSLDFKDMLIELIYSRIELERRLQHRIRYLCWPFGSYNKAAITAAREAGYEFALAVREDFQDLETLRPFAIKRITAPNDPDFSNKLEERLSSATA